MGLIHELSLVLCALRRIDPAQNSQVQPVGVVVPVPSATLAEPIWRTMVCEVMCPLPLRTPTFGMDIVMTVVLATTSLARNSSTMVETVVGNRGVLS